MKNRFKWFASVATLSLLLGCNGGGSGDSPDIDPSKLNNQAPIAIAGVNQNVKVATRVKLDGTGSVDKDHDLITYQWQFESKPQNSQATIHNPRQCQRPF